MFIYLSKKIAIPNNVRLKSVAWNPEQGWIACGGEMKLLKVLKLEPTGGKDQKTKGVAAPSNLSMNQTLDGHKGAVVCVTWNANYRKLTTSDETGLIIVWMMHKGMWFEEMINNRNKSVVRDMQWTADGQKICIVYEDGAVIVGSVDGSRLWGKELNMQLCNVEWSPDGRNILFVTLEGEVFVFDSNGNKISKMHLYALENSPSLDPDIIGIDWYDGSEGYTDVNAPTLAIAFQCGRVQISRGDQDDNPRLIDTNMTLSQCKWNSNGSVLALAGSQSSQLPSGDQREVSMVQFYDPMGTHLRFLKVPGSGISALTWEGGGLRIALAVDSYIYFANIRPDYKWGYFANTLVYSFNKPERSENCVVFWDTNSGERYTKYVKKLMTIRAAGENCVLISQSDDQSGQYILILCNAIGSPVDSKYIEISPLYITMTPYHIIVASADVVFVWQFRTPVSKLTSVDMSGDESIRRREGRERIFHIDDLPHKPPSDVESFQLPNIPIKDAICALCASETTLIVARESGTMHRYSLPHIALENTYKIKTRPQMLALNCNSTRMSIIDGNGILTFFDLDSQSDRRGDAEDGKGDHGHITGGGEHLAFERKDAWDMIWAEDNPSLFAMMEKTRMYIFQDLTPSDPILSSGYLSQFKDLQIKAVMLDEIHAQPEQPEKEFVLNFETKELQVARELLDTVGLQEAYQHVEKHSHPRLWRLLAEAALEELNFNIAERSFVRCSDFQGIQYVKRLRSMEDKMKQRAEVSAYFQRFDEAESLYREIDRKDLAIELRIRLGDWFRVLQLVQSGGGDDKMLTLAWNKIGDYYADRQKWSKAAQYYHQAKNTEALIDCFYTLEDYAGLEKLVRALPEGSDLLIKIGEKFKSVGIVDLPEQHSNSNNSQRAVQNGESTDMQRNGAVGAFLKAGDVKRAIDCCVMLNNWDRAVELAEAHSFPQIEGLLSKYATQLLEKGKELQAVELFRKANRCTDAAKLLAKIAQREGQTNFNPLRAKKLHVLSALEVERFSKRILDTTTTQGASVAQTTAQTLDNLMTHDKATGENKALDNAWHGAEAYHFYMLAQRQLYNGEIDAAMKTSLRLSAYEDVLNPKDIYSLIALTTFYNQHYQQCSKAFIRLESLTNTPPETLGMYEKLALEIFTENPPNDKKTRNQTCPNCGGAVKDWFNRCPSCDQKFYACTVTGRALVGNHGTIKCKVCKHSAYYQELSGLNNCPLCHSVMPSRY